MWKRRNRRGRRCRSCATLRKACGAWPGATRASDFGFGFKDYFAESNKRLLTVAQMETQLAVDNSRAIAAVDGVDVLFVGPMDLSASLNLPERFADPAFMDVLQLVSDNARSEGKAAASCCRMPR